MSPAPVSVPPEALAVFDFWKTAGPKSWFAKNEPFDRAFRDGFLTLHERAARGELDSWLDSPTAALALVLLLDQFPRNAFRDTPRMFATDQLALHQTRRAIERGHDQAVSLELRLFFYLPFAHAESLAEQERGVVLQQPLAAEVLKFAVEHCEIVRRFGRFPHRNAVLGRPSSDAELAFLAAGGFSG